ncbi:hypothetical protein K458DRAFT_366018 [Lentithecium fluviatile CBS 122367]|uniref:RING-type domain-containing protein n=1 Tax=Lentithecium fluviatile CBS 122367 TaxID=1168545 RepID=A0A6G1J3C2_9PLEO|nr:hypothetical protein K458DRAFT_366018 [Lentithecium fluviatile CBS 122367]
MNTRAASPPATARPKTSSSSIVSSHVPSSSHSPVNMASASSKPRGITPSGSRSSIKALEGDRTARPSSRDSFKQKMAKKAEDAPRPSKADEQLKALRTEFDGLRSHLTCKICDRLLYQPYTISCGHTYCYSCLCTWFCNNKSRKTCPDCRAVVAQPPAPAYVIRDMTLVFISRAELLPTGETIEQHTKWQKEEADAVQQDKDNKDHRTGGLFKGCFRSHHARGPSLQVVRDQEDGVERCPVCTWELEDGECVQCGLFFDDNGELTWTDSFTGFSDMDDMSERDMSGEDLDAEMDMEDADFDGYAPQDMLDYYPDEGNFMMQRFLEHGIPPQAAFGRRRPMSHSEAGSRRSYTQSIVSDMYTDEMDTVEEEDEDGMDEDSSMNDFIDDEEGGSSTSASASSTPGQTPQASSARPRAQGRARRVVESEASSTISSVAEEDEEEEDEGPIRRGQRNRAQTRILQRANGSTEPTAPPSSTSTDVSIDELDEDTQALLQSEGWMLQHNGPDDMGEEDDDSDGGRTTVGWDATAISNDRVRMGGSLTPTADRPRPNAPIRPPSRVGNPLRRRASLLSTSTANYEDGEADDDDSDLDQDGDITMAAMASLRNRRSRAQLRNASAFPNFNNRFANRGQPQGGAIDVDADDHSDNSQSGNRRRYNPRISRLFADHQRALQELQGGPLLDLEPRSITPIARPRTANRNRPSPAQAYSPFMPPAPSRLRTPLMNNSSNAAMNPRAPVSPPRRTVPSQSLSEIAGADNDARIERASSVSSTSNGSVILTPGTSTPTSQYSSSTIAGASVGAAIDMVDRPPSRVSRPPSAAGRRGSAGFSPVYPAFPHNNVGLNIQGRIFPHQGNPWASFVQPRGVRSRNSRQVLRDQSSTATLRAASSRANIREGVTSPQGVRPQASRIDLRPQPSRRRLNAQSSTRTLRASEHARPPQSPIANVTAPTQSPTQPTRFSQEERQVLARELVNNRMRALGQGAPPARNNPFVSGFRPPAAPSTGPATQHARSNSNESVNSGISSHTATNTPSSPGLTRRRSNRQIGATPPGVLQPVVHGGFQSPATTYSNSYFRARQNSLNGGSAFDMPLDASARGMSPMMAASLI